MSETQKAAVRIALTNAVYEAIRVHGVAGLKRTSLFNRSWLQSGGDIQKLAA